MRSRPAHVLTVTLRSPLSAEEVPELCDDAADILVFTRARIVRCAVGAIREPDSAILDAVARLALVARQVGAEVELVDACLSLRDIIELAGLADVVRVQTPLTGRGGTAARRRGTTCRCRGRS